MQFKIRHRFDAPLARVEAAMLAEDLTAFLRSHMSTIRTIEPLARQEEGTRMQRRTRYVPAPLIRAIGPKAVDPAWMAWVEESTYDRALHRMEFRNVPEIARLRELLENRGTVTLTARGEATERTIEGELRVKVLLVGRIAEKIIYGTAEKILEDEARALAAYLKQNP